MEHNDINPKPRSGRKLNYSRIIAVLIFAGLLLLAITWTLKGLFHNLEQGSELPDFYGKTVTEFQKEAEELGLNYEIKSLGDEVVDPETWIVVQQKPFSGLRVKAGAVVTVEVANPKNLREVPKVIGLTVSGARKKLELQGFKVKVLEKVSPETPPGVVFEQKPEAGLKIERWGLVELSVAGVTEGVTVPSVIGMSPEQARAVLEKLGFEVRLEPVEITGTNPVIVKQSIPPGGKGAKGQAIMLMHRQKSVFTMPNFEGLTLEQAREVARKYGIEVEIAPPDAPSSRKVTLQEPVAGNYDKAHSVKLVLEPTSVVPSLQGLSRQQAIDSLLEAGLVVGEEHWSQGEPYGFIIGQEPAGGIEVPPGTPVVIIIADPGSQEVSESEVLQPESSIKEYQTPEPKTVLDDITDEEKHERQDPPLPSEPLEELGEREKSSRSWKN